MKDQLGFKSVRSQRHDQTLLTASIVQFYLLQGSLITVHFNVFFLLSNSQSLLFTTLFHAAFYDELHARAHLYFNLCLLTSLHSIMFHPLTAKKLTRLTPDSLMMLQKAVERKVTLFKNFKVVSPI